MTTYDIQPGEHYIVSCGGLQGLRVCKAEGFCKGGDVVVRLRWGMGPSIGGSRSGAKYPTPVFKYARPRRVSVTAFRRIATRREVLLAQALEPVPAAVVS